MTETWSALTDLNCTGTRTVGTRANGTGNRCESSGNEDTWDNDGVLSVLLSREPNIVSYNYESVPSFIDNMVGTMYIG